VPTSLRVFLLTLAVADDIFAVVVLAVFYQHGVNMGWLLAAVAIVAIVALWRRPLPGVVYVLATVATWGALTGAHVEPALAGVAIGVLVPHHRGQPGVQLERATLPISNAIVLPLFALCACGLPFRALDLGVSGRQVVAATIVARVVGKTLGIAGVALLGRRLGLLAPRGVTSPVFIVAATLCAIGFTVPLLFAQSVYGFQSATYNAVTLGLLVASLIAGALGLPALAAATRRRSP
jgi:NhaA family Na+:H+ antiporter